MNLFFILTISHNQRTKEKKKFSKNFNDTFYMVEGAWTSLPANLQGWGLCSPCPCAPVGPLWCSFRPWSGWLMLGCPGGRIPSTCYPNYQCCLTFGGGLGVGGDWALPPLFAFHHPPHSPELTFAQKACMME